MFHYFGYGSNIDLMSLRAKGVQPVSSRRARLSGWKLLFNVHHWFKHEGGVGNIHPSEDPADQVLGVVHQCENSSLPLLDAVESYGVGYDRIEVEVETEDGPIPALTYIGIPTYLDDNCLPTQRYLNIIVRGAIAAGIDSNYIDKLRLHPTHVNKIYPVFEHPQGSVPEFTANTLAEYPLYTAVGGAVFDMQDARWQHHCLRELFGGKDMTLFHIKRLDSSDGTESIEKIRDDQLTTEQRAYLNAYLNEYASEYHYIGRFRY